MQFIARIWVRFVDAGFTQFVSHSSEFSHNKIRKNKMHSYINVLPQTACLVFNPITNGNFAFLFNCTLADRTSVCDCGIS